MGLADRSWNTDLPLWGGVALPLDPAFWEGVPPEGAGFLALVLAYIGSKFVVEVLLGR